MENLKKTIILKVTKDCNLNCKYCYETKRVVPSKFKEKTPSEIVKILNKNSNNCDFLFLLHGGEPLLIGKEEYKNLVSELQIAKENKNTYGIAIQTNGTLIDEKWIELLDSSKEFLGEREIGISIDGPKQVNDKMRVNFEGLGSFDKIQTGIKKLKENDFHYGLLIVVGKHNYSNYQEIYEYIKEVNPLLVRFIPLYDINEKGKLQNYSVSPSEFSEFLMQIYDLWLADTESKIPIDPFISIISNFSNSNTNWCEYNYEKCNNFLIIENNGLLGACDNWENENVYFSEKPIFDLSKEELSEIFAFKTASYKIIDDRINILTEDCKKCNYYEFCRGGCMATRHFFKNKNLELYSDYCIGKQMLIDKIKNSLDQLNTYVKQRT